LDDNKGVLKKILNIFNRRPDEQKYFFYDDFNGEILGSPPSKWIISRQSGEIYVHRGLGKGGTTNYLIISSPKGSDDTASITFPKLRKLYLAYEFRQDFFRGDRNGAGLNLYSDSMEAVWLGIISGELYYKDEDEYRVLIPVNIGEWYSVIIEVDCQTNKLSIRINDIEVLEEIHLRNDIKYLNKISSTIWINNENWQTCINNIIINGIQYE
jgi:hypothetical protein